MLWGLCCGTWVVCCEMALLFEDPGSYRRGCWYCGTRCDQRPRLVWLPGVWEHVGCWLVVCLLIVSIRGAGYFAAELEFVHAISRFRSGG